MGPTQGPYILQLCMGPSNFWRGLTLTLPYFPHCTTLLNADASNCYMYNTVVMSPVNFQTA